MPSNRILFTLGVAALLGFSTANAQTANAQTANAQTADAQTANAQTANAQSEIAPDDASSTRSENIDAANAPLSLRLRLRAGQSFRLTQVSQTKSVVFAAATKNRAAQKTESWSNDSVTAMLRVLWVLPNGDYRVRLTYENLCNEPITIINGQRTPKVAQAAAVSNAMNSALQNQALTLTLSPQGQIADVRGLEDFWRAMQSAFAASGFAVEAQKTIMQTVRNTFNESALRDTMERSGLIFPDDAVRIGDSWPQNVTLRGALPFVVVLQRTLQSRSDNTIAIAENGTLDLKNAQLSLPDNATSDNTTRFNVTMSGNYSGTTLLDADTRFVRSTRLTQRFGGTVSSSAASLMSQTSVANVRLFGRVFTKTIGEEIAAPQ